MRMSRLGIAVTCLCWAAVTWAEPLTVPQEKRPEWLRREGIVMAGSWEPLVFRVRRDGTGYVPTPEQQAAWQREHSEEMVARLKALGVNFVMTHCYKGAGLEAERESMADAVRFSRDVTGNRLFANLWTQAETALQNGQRLADTLFSSELIPNTIAQMIATGEKTGQMVLVMERISKLCEMELEDSIKTITSMLEPLMILIMGGVVGSIAFAVLLPIFQISKIMGAN